jgi:hypothetical protein
VDFIAQADYRPTSQLSERIKLILDSIIADIAYHREVEACHTEHRIDA